MLIDDLGDNRQAQSDAAGLGGEKRIEDAFQMFGLDAGAAVDDVDLDGLIELARLYRNSSLRRAGLRRIQQQIVHYPFHELAVEKKGRNIGR